MIKQTIAKVYADPLAEYEQKQKEIRLLLKQIEAGLEQHDRRASTYGGHHWGHVGDLTSIADMLNDISRRLPAADAPGRHAAFGRNGKRISVSVPQE